MQKLFSVFAALSPARQIIVLLATVGTVVAVLAIARGANTPGMTLLYSGIEPAAAGEVIAALEQRGVVHEVRGGAIFVDAAQRDSLRLSLAAEGKPASGTTGYEILDNLTGFGTTAQMFDAAYWRAKEGELARTILSSPGIQAARVHISNPSQRPFARQTQGTASVMITTAGGGLPPSQAKAIKFLVASAVQGISADQVTVIDSRSGVVLAGDEPGGETSHAAGGRAAMLRQNVERLLEARVGPGRAIVEVNVETVTEREEVVERIFDPDSRVAISTITEETTSNAQDLRDGAVTVAGNLPDGDAGGSGANSSSSDAGTREQVNYEVSETQREVLRLPGAVRRISVAVLVDGLRTTAEDGSGQWAPRSDAELGDLRELVASAVGFDEARGDIITLRSMEFPPIEIAGTEAPAPSVVSRLGLDPMKSLQLGVLAVVALILGLFVVRPILTGAGPQQGQSVPQLDPPRRDDKTASSREPAGAPENLPALSGPDGAPLTPNIAQIEDLAAIPALPELRTAEDPSERLKRIADSNSKETAAVLRRWMEERQAPA